MDLDNNGFTDLIVARDDGVHFYLNDQDSFTHKPLSAPMPADATPLAVAVADINKDGYFDLYISLFVNVENFRSPVFNDPTHAKQNLMLLGDGNFNFTDVTTQTQTGGLQNTFFSSFTDLDNDNDLDLILSQNTGEVEIYNNKGDLVFEKVPSQSNYGFWMGIGLGDIGSDGDQDVFLSNAGNSIPSFLVTGDLADEQTKNFEWLLLENKDNFQFEDATQKYELTEYGFAWGAVFEDLNADGDLDLLVMENYIKWPVHKISKLPGKSFMQLGSGEDRGFYPVNGLGLDNKHFGISSLIVDLNQDGFQDVVFINLDSSVRAFLNPNESDYIKIRVNDNLDFLGAKIVLETQSRKTHTKEMNTLSGLLTDHSNEVSFYFNELDGNVKYAKIKLLNGEEFKIVNPQINTTHILNYDADSKVFAHQSL